MTRKRGKSAQEFFAAGLAVAPLGYCQCGCGERTKISDKTTTREGYQKGVPRLFIHGHRHPDHLRRVVLDKDTGCWNMTGSTDSDGYVVMRWEGRQYRAPRFFYERILETTVPEGLTLDHLCRNRRCVNPDHLEPVTVAENTRRGLSTKLTPAQAEEIRASDETQRVLADRYGVGQPTISKIKRGQTWAAA